jgi:hypothetical protein
MAQDVLPKQALVASASSSAAVPLHWLLLLNVKETSHVVPRCVALTQVPFPPSTTH